MNLVESDRKVDALDSAHGRSRRQRVPSKHICIVTPAQLGMNPRVVKEADALHLAGYKVTVVSTVLADHVMPRDEAILRAARWSSVRVDFRRLWVRRLERSLQKAAQFIWRVLRRSELVPYAQSPYYRGLLRAVRKVRADLYIGHYVAGLAVAASVARARSSSFAFDAEDFHPGDLPQLPCHMQESLWIKQIESRWLPHAGYITAASPGIGEAYSAAYALPSVTTLLNVFPLLCEGTNEAAKKMPRSVYWFSQTRGTDRGLECAVKAISLSETKPHIFIRGAPQDGFDLSITKLAERLGVVDRLHLLDPCLPDELVRSCQRYSIGLVSETGSTRNRQIALTNKQFTYLLAGLPVLMSDVEAHRRFIREIPDAGFIYEAEKPMSLARALDQVFTGTEVLCRAGEAARRYAIDRFNWHHEQNYLLDCVDRLMNVTAAESGSGLVCDNLL